MSWLVDLISNKAKRAAEEAVESWLAGPEFAARVNEVHREQISTWPMNRRLTRTGFIWACAYRLWGVWKSPERDWVRCKETASEALAEFLRDEQCAFGDVGYRWDRGGAIEVADAYEVDHWEAA